MSWPVWYVTGMIDFNQSSIDVEVSRRNHQTLQGIKEIDTAQSAHFTRMSVEDPLITDIPVLDLSF